MAKCKNCKNLYNLSDENDVIVGKWCPKINNSPDVETERECVHYKRMTQADHIRSMRDEELAELLVEAENAGYRDDSITPLDKDCCHISMIDWLQSEVEE